MQFNPILLSTLFFIALLSIYIVYNRTPANHNSLFTNSFLLPDDSRLLYRKDVFHYMDDCFDKVNNGVKAVVLTGIGGAGKTTVARHYANLQKNCFVWEINATNQDTVMQSITNIALYLAKTNSEKKMLNAILMQPSSPLKHQKLIFFIKDKIIECDNWLIIYDNVQQFSKIKNSYLHPNNIKGRGRIIITTRNTHIQNSPYINVKNIIYLKELNNDQKMELFTKITTLPPNKKNDIYSLLDAIPPYPLDISVAAYYLLNNSISLANYVQNIKKEVNCFRNKNICDDNEYQLTRYSITVESINKVIQQNSKYKGLLFFCSRLDNKDIPIELLNQCTDEKTVKNFINILKEYSLIAIDKKDHRVTISIHKLIQNIIKHYIHKILNENVKKNIISSQLNVLHNITDHMIENNHEKKISFIIPHCKEYIKHLEGHPIEEGRLKSKIGFLYTYIQQYDEAKPYLDEGINLLTKVLPKDHIHVAKTKSYLGNYYRMTRNYPNAIKLLREANNILIDNYGQSHVEVALNSIAIGGVYRELGDFEKAYKLIHTNLQIIIRHYEGIHHRKIMAKGTLGNLYLDTRENQKARELFESIIKDTAVLHSNHSFNYAWAAITLGEIYRRVGQYDKAKVYALEGLNICTNKLGDRHLSIFRSKAILGDIHKSLGNLRQAALLLEDAYNLCLSNFGKKHIYTAFIFIRLGGVYLSQGNYEKAESIFIESLKTLKERRHPTYYTSLEKIADYYGKISTNDPIVKDNTNSKRVNYLKQAYEYILNNFPNHQKSLARIKNKLNCHLN